MNWGNGNLMLFNKQGIKTGWASLPGLLSGKEFSCQGGAVGNANSIPGLGRSSGGLNSNPLQYSCLGNLLDRGAWRATVHGVTKSQT